MPGVRPRIAQQPAEFAHARTLNASAAAITSGTQIRSMAVRVRQDVRFGPPGRPVHRIAGAEQNHHRNAECRRDVRRAAVVADEQLRARHQALYLRQGRVAPDSKSCERRWNRRRAGQEDRLQPGFVPQVIGDGKEALRGPRLLRRRREGMNHGVCARDRASARCSSSRRARDLGARHAHPEHRGSEMFGRVHADALPPKSPARAGIFAL